MWRVILTRKAMRTILNRSGVNITRTASVLVFVLLLASLAEAGETQFHPGAVWPDADGVHINAHGGAILSFKGTHYWFGEKRGARTSEGVAVYSSSDLHNWKNEGLALGVEDGNPQSDIARGCVIERPKVLFNKKTKQWVMWFHLELRGQGYRAARAAVAVSDRITGPYRFISSFRPNGNMSRDMTLFQEKDGRAYLIYSSRDNYDMRVAQLTDDYLSVTPHDVMMFSEHREAPAIFKYKGTYYLITSACTGWNPNQARLHSSESIFGPWQSLGDPMRGPKSATTFDGQSTFILPVPGHKDQFVFMADRWRPTDLGNSSHIWLPIQFENGVPVISWADSWDLGFFDLKNTPKSD